MSDDSILRGNTWRLWRHVVSRCWEDPELHQTLSQQPDSVVAREAALMGCEPCECAAVVSRVRDSGIPSSANEFASRATDFVVGWEDSFYPAGKACAGVPFGDLFVEAAQPVVGRLEAQCGTGWNALTRGAHDDLLADASRLIGSLSVQPVQMLSALSDLDAESTSHDSRRWADVWPEILSLYPAMQSVFAIAAETWVNSTTTLLTRLSADRWLLSTDLGIPEDSEVVSIRQQLSDRHSGGQTVVRLGFTDGHAVYYKPRDVGLELGWNGLLGWFNQRGFDFKPLHVIRGSGYGWVEAVEPGPCTDLSGVRDYFRRAGAMTALAWVVGATDLHMGNVIASGAHPMFVDCEALFAGNADTPPGLRPLCFLPCPEPGPYPFDLSGLGGWGNQPTDRRIPYWSASPDGVRTISYASAVLSPCANIVWLDGQRQHVGGRLEALLEGFGRMADCIMAHRAQLADVGGPVLPMTHYPRRCVVRSTRTYYQALNVSLQLRHLRSEQSRRDSIRATLSDATQEEVEELLQLDIPRGQAADPARAAALLNGRLDALDDQRKVQQQKEIEQAIAASLVAALSVS